MGLCACKQYLAIFMGWRQIVYAYYYITIVVVRYSPRYSPRKIVNKTQSYNSSVYLLI